MDPWTIGAGAGASLLGGMLGGDQQGDNRTKDERYYGGHIAAEQARGMAGQNRFANASFADRLKALQLQNAWNAEAFGQSKTGFQRMGDTYNRAGGMMGQPINDPRANVGMMQQAIRPQMMGLIGQYSKQGMRNSGAIAGGLAKQQSGQVGGYMLDAMDRESYARSQRDQNLLGIQASLYR